MSGVISLLRHELRLQARARTEWAALLLFFGIILLVLPFAIGPEPDLLRRLGPGLVWLAALLMSLLALDRLFVADARDGTLDLMLLSPLPLALIVFVKLIALTLIMIALLAVMVFPAALMLGMDFHIVPVLFATLMLGIPSLVLLGGLASAITVALRRSPALLTLLLIPFYIPILIFAVAACDAAALGMPAGSHLLFLGAALALLLPAVPFVIAPALRQGQE